MGEKKTGGTNTDTKIQKMSQNDEINSLCPQKNSNNKSDCKIANAKYLPPLNENLSIGNEVKSLQTKTKLSSWNDWHNLLLGKKYSNKTNKTKIKSNRRSGNILFVDMLDGKSNIR